MNGMSTNKPVETAKQTVKFLAWCPPETIRRIAKEKMAKKVSQVVPKKKAITNDAPTTANELMRIESEYAMISTLFVSIGFAFFILCAILIANVSIKCLPLPSCMR